MWGPRPMPWSARRARERQGIGGIGGIGVSDAHYGPYALLATIRWSDGTAGERVRGSQGSSNCLDPSEGCRHGEDHCEVVRLVCPCEAETQARERGEQR